MTAFMKLGLAQLKTGENPLRYSSKEEAWVRELAASVAKEGTKVLGELEIDLTLTNLEPDFFLTGAVRFSAEQVCGRCAESFPLPIIQPIALGLAHVKSAGRGESEDKLSDDSEELDIHYFEGNELDLAPLISEAIFLSIPFAPICRPDCKGICQNCGSNLNMKACSCQNVKPPGVFSRLSEYQCHTTR
jgi:uncharacterized metal-binding protein YceD (DUF177 family)